MFSLALLVMNIVLIVILLAWLDKGKLISPASARVGPTELERLRARGLDLSRRQLASQRHGSVPGELHPLTAALPVATTLIAKGGD
jgi:NADH-quinone oxidoreductase subunit H